MSTSTERVAYINRTYSIDFVAGSWCAFIRSTHTGKMLPTNLSTDLEAVIADFSRNVAHFNYADEARAFDAICAKARAEDRRMAREFARSLTA